MGRYRYVVCDVFTDNPLTGNQLAVFTDARELPEARLQELARETEAGREAAGRGEKARKLAAEPG